MKRRSFIMAAVATATAVAIPAIYHSSRQKKSSGDPLITPDILERFCNETEINEIGLGYRSMMPTENTKTTLTEILLLDANGKKSESSSKSAIAKLLQRKIQQEYSAYKTIIVNGWVISPTEARQCALFSLTHI